MNQEQLNAQKKEKGYVIGRQAALIVLALGTTIAMYKLGRYIALENFPSSKIGIILTPTLLIFMGFFAIDFIAQNALASASDITSQADQEIKDSKGNLLSQTDKTLANRILMFARFAIIASVALSTFSNWFVSSDLVGENKLSEVNSRIDYLTRQDSLNKAKAFELLASAGEEETKRIETAKAEAAALLSQAIAKGSPSWQNDYQAHKNNPNGWFWTCTDCPTEYKTYRKSILRAIERGNEKIGGAVGYSQDVRSSIAPTLSYKVENDSTMTLYTQNIYELEKERKSKAKTLFWLMTAFTVICALVAYSITIMLTIHRKRFGQYVIEDNVTPIEQAIDMFQKIIIAVRDIFYTIFSLPYSTLQQQKWIKHYQLATSEQKLTLNAGRSCKNGCGTSIEHMSKKAKFCSDDCRNEWHNNHRS